MILRQGPGAPALAAAVVLLVVGCGEKRETTTGGASSPTGGLTVSETEFKLSPPSTQVDPGGGTVAITVKNDGSVEHALEVDGPSGAARTGTIAPGATATLSTNLSTPGTYTVFCPIDGHWGKGMRGTIKVG